MGQEYYIGTLFYLATQTVSRDGRQRSAHQYSAAHFSSMYLNYITSLLIIGKEDAEKYIPVKKKPTRCTNFSNLFLE